MAANEPPKPKGPPPDPVLIPPQAVKQADVTPCDENIGLSADDDDHCGLSLDCELDGDKPHEVHMATRWTSQREGNREITLSWRSKRK